MIKAQDDVTLVLTEKIYCPGCLQNKGIEIEDSFCVENIPMLLANCKECTNTFTIQLKFSPRGSVTCSEWI